MAASAVDNDEAAHIEPREIGRGDVAHRDVHLLELGMRQLEIRQDPTLTGLRILLGGRRRGSQLAGEKGQHQSESRLEGPVHGWISCGGIG